MAYRENTEGLELNPVFPIMLPMVCSQLPTDSSMLHQLTVKISEKGKKKSIIASEHWKRECQKAFDELLTTAPMLAYPYYCKPFMVETNASGKGLGVVLSQKQDGKLRVIAYASRDLHGAEQNMKNYSSMKVELLALK